MRRNILMSLAAVAVAGSMTTATAQQGAQTQTAKAKPPAALPIKPVAFPPFAERTLSNGAQVLIVENHEQPVVSINIYMRGGGTASDTDAKPGVASLTASLLDAGTKSLTSKQLAEKVEGMGAQLNTAAAGEWASMFSTMLKSDVDEVLGVMADVLVNATYPADELETERRRALTDLQVALSRPATLAQRAFDAHVFGKHPYGRLTTTASLRSITREDLVAFHQTYYKPGNALIVVAGDVDPADITARLQKHLAGWTGQGPARPKYPAAPAIAAREIVLVNKPGAVQAAFRIGHTIVPATHPDWPAIVVAQQILGGGSNGWLYENLREKKGFTYGAYAQTSQRLDPGFFQMWGDVRNEVADSAMDLFLSLEDKMRKELVPAADLELAKAWLTGNFPLTIETPSQIAAQVATAMLIGQPKDHVQTWRTRIAAVTAADVQRVARTHFLDKHMIVVSGDANILKPKLARFGKVTVVDEELRPVADAAPPKAGPTGIDASSIGPQTLVYTVSAQGNPIAEMTRVVTRETVNGKEIVKATSTTTGMFTGKSELKFVAKTFTPLSANMSQQMGGREMSSSLSVEGGKVSGMMMSPASPDPAMIDSPIAEGTILPGMDEFAIWVHNFDTTKELKISTFSPQSGSIVPVTMKVVGESKQKVAAGEFDTYELEMTTAQGGMKAFVRKAAPHIMIKQEMLAQPIVVELKSLQ